MWRGSSRDGAVPEDSSLPPDGSATLLGKILRWLKDQIQTLFAILLKLLSQIRLAGKRALIIHVHSLVAGSMVAVLVVFTLVGSLFVTIRIVEESSQVAVEVKGVFDRADLPEWWAAFDCLGLLRSLGPFR